MFKRFIHAVACIRMSFAFKDEQYSVVCVCHALFIHSSLGGRLDCFHFLTIQIMLLWTLMYKCLFKSLLSVLWGTYPEVELLSHRVILSCVWLFATPWIAALQASLSITNSWNLPRLMSIKSVMPSNHLILYCPVLLPSVFPSIRVFSSESVLRIRWPKYWNFSFSFSPSSEHPGLISFSID